MMFYVYEHWRTDREEPFYVGKGKGNRAYVMKCRNKHHKAIQEKVLREGFAIEVKIVESGLSEEEAFQLECSRIRMWRKENIDLTNMTDGGEGSSGREPHNKGKPGRPHTQEHKDKMSIKFKGRTSPTKGMIPWNKGKTGFSHTDEAKEKIAAAGIGRTPHNKGKKTGPRSEETKAKISVGNKGKLKGRQLPDSTKLKMSKSQKEKWKDRKQLIELKEQFHA
jgi:hypothetical protein